MSDGIKAYHEELEDQYAQAEFEKFNQNDPRKVLKTLKDIRKGLGWLRNQELRLTRSEHTRLDDVFEQVNDLIDGRKV